MANPVLMARKASVILLVSLGIVVAVSSILLETAPEGPGSGEWTALGISKHLWTDIHVYAGFALGGVAIVHAYTNYRAILYHFGLLGLLRRNRRRLGGKKP